MREGIQTSPPVFLDASPPRGARIANCGTAHGFPNRPLSKDGRADGGPLLAQWTGREQSLPEDYFGRKTSTRRRCSFRYVAEAGIVPKRSMRDMATGPMSGVLRHLRRTALRQDGAGLSDSQLLQCFVRN